MEDWSARQYLKFEDDRTRPPRDLLAQVPLQKPKRVVDLGCGPGNSTELLVARYPDSEVVGMDSSPDMLKKARERLPKHTFFQDDITTWTPEPGTDLLFSNAVMQWLPDHTGVMRRLVELLPKGGVLAVQMPDNTREPALRFQREVGEEGPWADDPEIKAAARDDLPTPEAYYDLLPHRHLAHRLQSRDGEPGSNHGVVQGFVAATVPVTARAQGAGAIPGRLHQENHWCLQAAL
jgi:trans-aconitate 2-methyltransferase